MRIMQLPALPFPSGMLRHPPGRFTACFDDARDDFPALVFPSGSDESGDLGKG